MNDENEDESVAGALMELSETETVIDDGATTDPVRDEEWLPPPYQLSSETNVYRNTRSRKRKRGAARRSRRL